MFCRTFGYFAIISLMAIGFCHAQAGQSISFDKFGAEAAKKSGTKGLAITELWNGYRIDCRMQDLQAEVTMSGALIRSTSESEGQGVFSIRAARIGRGKAMKDISIAADWVNANDGVVRFGRKSVVEEYTASGDGIRQDFVITHRPGGKGTLVLELAVEGADPITAGDAVKVRLASGRELAYHALNVIDAAGKTLIARFEKVGDKVVAVTVDDKVAKYPIRIDPTISDADWVSMGGVPGVNGEVYDLTVYRSGNLYAGGKFTAAGNTVANNIAKWNGCVWSALGSGLNNAVNALVIDSSGILYAGGSFDTAGGIAAKRVAAWDGNGWKALGSGTNNIVSALSADDSGNLFAGGGFDTAGGVVANHIAKWDGNAWSALGRGTNGSVSAIAVEGSNNLYAGGWFDTAGDVPANNIAKWDGSAWSAFGSGMRNSLFNSGVEALITVGSGNLYAGGWFDTAGDVPANNIAKWDGSAWSALGSGLIAADEDAIDINVLAIDGSGNLYAGGRFDTAGGVPANNIAKWDGNTWSAFGSGMSGEVYALAADDPGNLYAGGGFNTADCVSAKNIAQWNGSTWSTLGSGTNTIVSALSVDDSGNLYAGGGFTRVGGIAANNIAKWDGSIWSALGSGTNQQVTALAVDSSDNLYAGGYFDTAGGVAASHIAQWDGSAWSALGSGMDGKVLSLAADGSGNLYAGGRFNTADGAVANSIAKWDGVAWNALGRGMVGGVGSLVYALAMGDSSNLYAGGYFSTAGGTSANNIAKWDGSGWRAIGNGINFEVNALTFDGSGNLYAGGYFSTPGGRITKNIARWDGSEWSELDAGINGEVLALAADGSGNLFAGGRFTMAGGEPMNFITRWDGSAWNALGSGTNNDVFALALDGSGNLFAGGGFTIAGGKVSAYLAQCKINTTAVKPRAIGNSSLPSIAYDSRYGILRFRLQSAADVTYRIFTLTGREVFRSSEFLSKGDQSIGINTASLALGVYILHFKAGGESMRWRMVVKKK